MFIVAPEFTTFLRIAKLSTYAAQGDEATVSPLLPGSKQLEYASAPFLYRDIYVGMFGFAGQEVVYLEGQPYWSMAYSGGLMPVTTNTQATAIYQVLRSALSAVPEALPLRGPARFEHQGFSYACTVTGDIDRFHGWETISHAGQLVYELRFSGGGLG